MCRSSTQAQICLNGAFEQEDSCSALDGTGCFDGNCADTAALPGYLHCGWTEICSGGQQCCLDDRNGRGTCQPPSALRSTCSSPLWELDCDGPNDCGGGQMCCYYGTQGGGITQCVTAASCAADNGVVICDPLAGGIDNPSCGPGQRCSELVSDTIGGVLSFCRIE